MVYTRIVQPGIRRKYFYTPGERTILRVSGTIIPKVWPMCTLTMMLTVVLCFIYDPIRRAEKNNEALAKWQRLVLYLFRDMERVLAYFTGFLTFILGFFNSIVFSRWWKMRELCGNIIEGSLNTAMHVAVFFVKPVPEKDSEKADEERNADAELALQHTREELIRLIGLGQALALQAAHRVRDLDWVIEQQLLERDSDEHHALVSIPGPGYNEVYGWCIDLAYGRGAQGMVEPAVQSSVLYSIRWALMRCSNDAEDLLMYLNQPVPLAYYHLLEMMVLIYILIASVALVPSLLWVAIAISPIVTLFFYGTFVLGTAMLMDPFVKDSGFDTKTFMTSTMINMESLERNVPLSRRRGPSERLANANAELSKEMSMSGAQPVSPGLRPSEAPLDAALRPAQPLFGGLLRRRNRASSFGESARRDSEPGPGS